MLDCRDLEWSTAEETETQMPYDACSQSRVVLRPQPPLTVEESPAAVLLDPPLTVETPPVAAPLAPWPKP